VGVLLVLQRLGGSVGGLCGCLPPADRS